MCIRKYIYIPGTKYAVECKTSPLPRILSLAFVSQSRAWSYSNTGVSLAPHTLPRKKSATDVESIPGSLPH